MVHLWSYVHSILTSKGWRAYPSNWTGMSEKSSAGFATGGTKTSPQRSLSSVKACRCAEGDGGRGEMVGHGWGSLPGSHSHGVLGCGWEGLTQLLQGKEEKTRKLIFSPAQPDMAPFFSPITQMASE